MKILDNLRSPEINKTPLVMAMGNFDGVHLGHRLLLEHLMSEAAESKALPTILTFSPHPLKVVAPDKYPPLLLTQEQKFRKFAEAGVAMVINLPFDREMAAMSPDSFVREVLVEKLYTRGIVVGYNFNFGLGGKGTAQLLKSYRESFGFFVEVVPPVRIGGTVVSSTVIRRYLQDGRVEKAGEFLGYTPFVEGLVVRGRQVGQTLGYPTANLEVPEDIIIPARGVYAVRVRGQNRTLYGVANIGVRPTFTGEEPRQSVEIHILNFNGDLYGENITVEFARRIRPEKKFASIAELVAQITVDARLAMQYFGLPLENNRAGQPI